MYDTIVIGGGPAGYTAALYAVRAGLKTLLIEQFAAGGQMVQTAQIDNYPGVESGIDGFTLGQRMQQQAQAFGALSVQEEVISVDLMGNEKKIVTTEGEYVAKTVIVATGANPRRLGISGEQALIGKGISYCATCDGALYKKKVVGVVGGGNTAAEDALLLARFCERVYLIHRRGELRASKVYRDGIASNPKIVPKFDRTVEELLSDQRLQGVVLYDHSKNVRESLTLDGLFVSVGRVPATELFRGQLELDENGYIVADETTRTSCSGVFAAGDVRKKPVRQIVTATADGAVAVHFAEEYLNG